MPIRQAGIGVAVLAAGADAVRVGTRFVAAEEAGVHLVYAEALIQARAQDSVHADTISVGWNAPHRVLRGSVAAPEAFQGDIVGERVAIDGTLMPRSRFEIGTATRAATGAIEATPQGIAGSPSSPTPCARTTTRRCTHTYIHACMHALLCQFLDVLLDDLQHSPGGALRRESVAAHR
ncbi:MAG: hypothetical protein IT305_15385 [Chloroflexi bacterium]|nr:hypothetical protein [Chloroflexota bacterium]